MRSSVWILTACLAALFATVAAAVMGYITLVVGIGPWIDVTLALMTCALMQWAIGRYFSSSPVLAGVMATAAGSIGGIVANAVSWSIPTLYFLDQATWSVLCTQSLWFVCIITVIIGAAGGLGLLIAKYNAPRLVVDAALPFPIAQLVYKTIAVREQIGDVIRLLHGILSVSIFHLIQTCTAWIPRMIVCIRAQSILCWRMPLLIMSMDTVPMLWAIGFIAGHVIAIPYGVGLVMRVILLEPCHRWLFSSCAFEEVFLLAFCTGLVVYGAMSSFGSLWSIRNAAKRYVFERRTWYKSLVTSYDTLLQHMRIDYAVVLGLIMTALWYYSQLSLISILYVVIGTGLCAYQLIVLMGRVGLAPLGRFATFVMVPGLLLFRYSPLQATMVAAFVEISGGVAASAASGYKAVWLADKKACDYFYPLLWLGLCISALVASIVFVILVQRLGLGEGSVLLAQRAQSRALLIQAHEMHLGAMMLGILCGWVLQQLHCNTTLVLGGILMPLQYSLLLIGGGMSSRYLCTNKELYYPFWSGVFSASALWMIIRALIV